MNGISKHTMFTYWCMYIKEKIIVKEGVKHLRGVWRIQNELNGYAQKWYKSNADIWNSQKYIEFKLK